MNHIILMVPSAFPPDGGLQATSDNWQPVNLRYSSSTHKQRRRACPFR